MQKDIKEEDLDLVEEEKSYSQQEE